MRAGRHHHRTGRDGCSEIPVGPGLGGAARCSSLAASHLMLCVAAASCAGQLLPAGFSGWQPAAAGLGAASQLRPAGSSGCQPVSVAASSFSGWRSVSAGQRLLFNRVCCSGSVSQLLSGGREPARWGSVHQPDHAVVEAAAAVHHARPAVVRIAEQIEVVPDELHRGQGLVDRHRLGRVLLFPHDASGSAAVVLGETLLRDLGGFLGGLVRCFQYGRLPPPRTRSGTNRSRRGAATGGCPVHSSAAVHGRAVVRSQAV